MQHPLKKKRTAKNRKRRAMLFLGAALVLALAFVLALPAIQRAFPGKRGGQPSLTLPYLTLDEGDADDLREITVEQREGETYTLVYKSERLYLQKKEALELVDHSLAQKLILAATLIAVEDTVSEGMEEIREHLPDMGLEPPEIVVRVSYQSGREDVLQLGLNVPETTYYYYRWSGSDKVYMCDEGVHEAFQYPSALLLPVDQIALEKNLIDRMTIQIQGQETMEIQLSTDASGLVSGVLLSPYAYPLGADAAASLVAAASNFRLGAVEGEVTSKNLAEYGFDDPFAVIDIRQQAGVYAAVDETGALVTHEVEEATLSIVLGRKEGEYFYTCRYGGKCYYVSEFLVSAMVSALPDSLITQNPADMGDAILAEIKVQLGGSLLDFRQQRVERVLPNNQLDVDEDGNTLYDVVATRNGEPISAEAFFALEDRLKNMRVSGELPAQFTLGTATPRWQLTLTTLGGATRTIAAYPMDAFFDAIAVDGMLKHTLQAESLEFALAELAQ